MSTAKAPRAGDWLTTLAASFGFAVVQLDVTIVNVALPALARGFGVGVASLQWVVDAYALAFAVLLLTAGVLGDRFGARRAYVGGFGLFALASLACGLAPGPAALIAARAAQGVGAALLVPSSLTLLNNAHGADPAGRARAVGVWTAAGGVSIALGPVLGGLLVASLGWRSIFLVNLPVCVAGALLTLRAAPRDTRPAKPRPLDPLGQALAALALTGLIGAVIEARPRGLTDAWVLAGLALFLTAGGGFIAAERRAASPALPLGFFRKAGFSAAIAFGVIVNLAYYGMIFVLALYLQDAHRWTPLQAGLAFLPLTATFIASNLVSGPAVARFGSRGPMAIGAAIAAVGYFLLLPLSATSPFLVMLPGFLLIPSGMGLGVPAMTTAILASVEREWSGTASAVLNAARQAGGAIGVAAFGVMSGALGAAGGLHAAAATAVALLVLAAVISVAWVRGA
ncbi:MAG TPA: MFS transporter [Phenylobacterium sp.]|jgi:DHA2 family methylenomycin A resistance protein-like MFS transporter